MRRIVVNPKDRPASIDPGPAPMLAWLPIDSLTIDESYQRELRGESWRAIRRIAQQFRWSRFSPVFVAPIEGGRYAIIDGQHRTHAAAMCGFVEIPCQIVQMSPAEQAASFAAVNGLVTKVSIGQIFKAARAAADPLALECFGAVEAAGCRLMTANTTTAEKRPGEIYAVGLVRNLVKAGKAELMTLALDALRQAECGAIADYWTGPVLKVWLNGVCDRPRLAGRRAELTTSLDDIDLWQLLDDAEETAKKKRRLGFAGITRYDLALAALGERLDHAFGRAAAE